MILRVGVIGVGLRGWFVPKLWWVGVRFVDCQITKPSNVVVESSCRWFAVYCEGGVKEREKIFECHVGELFQTSLATCVGQALQNGFLKMNHCFEKS